MHGTLWNRQQTQRKALADFVEENSLVVTDTFFEKAENRYLSREAQGGMAKNQINFILSLDRNIVGCYEVTTKGDNGSNHTMGRAIAGVNKKSMRLKKIQKQNHSN